MVRSQAFSSTGERVGLALVATAGLASALSTCALISYILWTAFLAREKSSPLPRGIRSFTRSSLGFYLISLLICDILQGVAFSLNYRWSIIGLMEEGSFCTLQGAVSEIGDLGAAIWSTAIAFHSFWLLFLVKKPHPFTVPTVLVGGWSLIIFLSALGPTVLQTPRRGSFYGLSGAWCWIAEGYGVERLIYLYAWVFMALAFSLVLYALIYLRLSNVFDGDGGNLVAHRSQDHSGGTSSASQHKSRCLLHFFRWFNRAKVTRTPDDNSMSSGIGSQDNQIEDHLSTADKPLRRVGHRIMWYPIVYAIVVLPVSVCRMGVLAGWEPPFPLLVFAGMCFASSGATNVVLFITTRHRFIKQVAQAHITRVHITTQRITVHDDFNVKENGTEMTKFHDRSGLSPGWCKDPAYPASVETASYMEGEKDAELNLDSN